MTIGQKESFLPSTRSEIFVAVCFAITLGCVLGLIFLLQRDSETPTGKTAESVLLLTALVSLSLSSSVMITFGIRTARREGVSSKTVRTPVVGLVLCLFLAFVSWHLSSDFGETYKLLEDIGAAFTIRPQERELLGPEKYSELTKSVARNRFVMAGDVTEYTTPEGQVVLYEPTDVDREQYWRVQVQKDYMASGKVLLRGVMFFWLSLALSGILVGLFTPIRKTAYVREEDGEGAVHK